VVKVKVNMCDSFATYKTKCLNIGNVIVD